ncbi:hypothetical protein KAW48_03190, partial [candidate division WOR-3 bacterium]|nr:hypothetical protein [candidate division WOR-3 bacterium]
PGEEGKMYLASTFLGLVKRVHKIVQSKLCYYTYNLIEMKMTVHELSHFHINSLLTNTYSFCYI